MRLPSRTVSPNRGRTLWVSLLLGLFAGAPALLMAQSPSPQRANPKPREALGAVVRAFESHDVVLLGEIHWSVAQHRFIQRLIGDNRLPAAVHIIAVEFANARYQPVIDEYVAGGTVTLDSLRHAWQDVIVPLAWDASVYPQFFQTIRTLNRSRSANRQLRVLALDPPIPWDSVRTSGDIPRAWGSRDPVWFDILEREVLSQGRKALVIAGGLHVIRRDPVTSFQPAPLARAGLGDALTQRYAARVYSIYPALGNTGIARFLRGWPASTLADVPTTTLGARSSHLLMPGNVTVFTMVNGVRVPRSLEERDYPTIEQLVDAVAYYGPDTTLAPIVFDSYRDSAYVAELHRRSAVVQPMFGQDLDPVIDSLSRAACQGPSRGRISTACRRRATPLRHHAT